MRLKLSSWTVVAIALTTSACWGDFFNQDCAKPCHPGEPPQTLVNYLVESGAPLSGEIAIPTYDSNAGPYLWSYRSVSFEEYRVVFNLVTLLDESGVLSPGEVWGWQEHHVVGVEDVDAFDPFTRQALQLVAGETNVPHLLAPEGHSFALVIHKLESDIDGRPHRIAWWHPIAYHDEAVPEPVALGGAAFYTTHCDPQVEWECPLACFVEPISERAPASPLNDAGVSMPCDELPTEYWRTYD